MNSRSKIIVAVIACAVLILGVVGVLCVLHQPNMDPAESDSEITVYTEPVSDIPETEITEPENPDETEPGSEESTTVDEDSEWTTPIESDADGEESKSPDTLEETETADPEMEESNTGEPDTTEPETNVSEPSQDSCLDGGEHNYISNTVQATCITEGKTVYTCAECGYSYAVTVSALGHTWGDWTTILEPSCSAEGHKERSCSSCGSIGTQTIETSPHEFSKYETVHKEEKAYIVSYCALCGAQNETITEGAFMSTDSGVQDEVFLWSVGRDFSFDVVCDQGIDYVKDRVTVLESNLQYASSDIINAEKEAIKVSEVSPNTWRVTSTSSLDENTRYWVSLEEDISFVDYPGQTLTFFTEGGEKEHVRYSSDILYLRELENASPGYYPYTYEYDTETEHAYVTVSKAGILDESLIGTLICVGECTDLNTVEGTKDGEVSVGKLESIQVRDGKTVLVLTAPSMLELFDELDIHSDRLTSLIENSISEEMQQDMVEQLIRSDGFAKVLAIQSTATRQYANEQGWDVAPLKISKDNFTFDPSTTQVRKADGSVAGVVVTIPVYFSYDDKIVTDGEVELGKAKFDAEFTLTITFMLDCTTNFKQYLNFWNREDILKFDLTVVQNTEVNFKFSITIEMDYDYQEGLEKDDQEYLIHNPVSKVIHRESCRMAISLKDDPSNRKTYKDVYTIYEERTVDHECDWCQPITRDGSLFVKNTESGLYHCISCTHVNNMTRKENLILIKWLPFSTHDGIYCQDCKPQQYLKDFAQNLDEALKNGDWADAYEDIKKQLGNLFDEKGFVDASDAIDKKTEPILIVPDVFVIFELQIYFAPVIEFDFDATVNFEYNFYNQYIYTYQLVKEDKEYTIKGDISKGVIVDENGKPKQSGFTLDIKGKVEAKLGGEVMLKLNVWFADEWLYIAVGAEVGVYTELTGVLHIDNIKDDAVENYVAAYLEAGLYCELYCQFRVGPTGDKRMVLVPESKARLALIKAGNDRVYYGFETYDWDVIRIGNSGIYMLPQKLLKAKYLDLTNDFAKGSDTLSFAGGKDYRLVYKIVGSDALAQYVSIEDGVIRIHEEAPDSFEATILISVIEIEKEYSSFKEYYDEVIVKGQRSNSYRTGVLSIDIQFDRNRGEDEEPSEPEDPVYSEGLSFTSNGDGTCNVSGIGDCNDLDVVIPSVSPSGDRLTSIGDYAFFDCSGLTSIKIPDSVTSIGDYAFFDCSGLTSIVLPKGVTSIGGWVFYGCSGLTSIEIPDSVTSIGDWAFYDCSGLTSIVIPEGVTSIGDGAFESCSGLISIVIPPGVTSIGHWAFLDCYGLTSIVIPDRVTSIGNYAFFDCSGLTSIEIPDSVTSIGYEAFYLCRKLVDVFYTGTMAQWEAIAIDSRNDNLLDAVIHCTDGDILP